MKNTRVRRAATSTGRGLGIASLALLSGLAAIGEEQQRQREIQEHTDALKKLNPDYDIMLIRKA